MIETLKSHRDLLSQCRVTASYTPLEKSAVGFRLTMGIYLQILDDAVSVLNSLIDYLGSSTDGNTDK
jgi:hypothetical protein